MRKIIQIIFFLLIFTPSSAFAAAWYFDKDAAGTNAGTSWTDAWTGFSSVVWGGAGVVAGDTLYISGGSTSKTYTATGDNMLTVGASGSAGNLITIATGAKSASPSGHDGKVIFDGVGSYAVLINCNAQQYVKFDGEKSGVINWEIYNTKRTGAYSSSNYAVGLTNAVSSSGKVFTYIRVHDVSDGINAGAVANGAGLLEISYCDLHDVIGDHLINVTGTAAQTAGNILIHHNTLTNLVDASASNAGPDTLQGTRGIDVYNNTFIASAGTTIHTQHPDFIQFNYDKCRVWNNTFDGRGVNGIQVVFANGEEAEIDFKFYNNVITRVNGAGLTIGFGSGATSYTAVIANNTFVDNAYSTAGYMISGAFQSAAAVPTLTIENNIFFNSGWGTSIQAMFLRLNSTDQLAGITYNYNVVNSGAHGGSKMQYYVSSDVNMPAQANGQTGVPSFLAYTEYSGSNDYNLTSGDTVAKNNGVSLSSYFTTDLLGNTRTGTFDIGAYEFMGNTTLGSGSGFTFAGAGFTLN